MKTIRDHWDKIYSSKLPNELSWTQEVPRTSLEFIHKAHLKRDASIIDIGGGESKLVDFLLAEGYENITVLDISEQALNKTKQRLGRKAGKVKWILSDINDFIPVDHYDFWHDRATFHFLTLEPQIEKYLSTAREAVKLNGIVTVGTFRSDGPEKCSGLEVKRYQEETLAIEFEKGFKKLRCLSEAHITPFNTVQHFLFCSFQRSLN